MLSHILLSKKNKHIQRYVNTASSYKDKKEKKNDFHLSLKQWRLQVQEPVPIPRHVTSQPSFLTHRNGKKTCS